MVGRVDPDFSEDLPPEVPEEFADAYREAYRRALREDRAAALDADQPASQIEPDPEPQPEPEAPAFPVVQAADPVAGRHRVTEYRTATPLEKLRESRWFWPALVALGLLLVLLLFLFVVRARAGGKTGRETSPPAPVISSPTAGAHKAPARKHPATPYRGPVHPVAVRGEAATCTMPPGFDSARHRVSYEVANTVDGQPETAWRCRGDAVGERLVFVLPPGTRLAEVGLIPGYAKVDPRSGIDRYAENNRITKVRWIIGRHHGFMQTLDPDPEKRDAQTMRIPVMTAQRVVLVIEAVDEGRRGSTAISEVRLEAAR